MDELQMTVRFAIHAGRLDQFKQIAARCLQRVRDKDSGTLQYDWFLSADGSECVLRERRQNDEQESSPGKPVLNAATEKKPSAPS